MARGGYSIANSYVINQVSKKCNKLLIPVDGNATTCLNFMDRDNVYNIFGTAFCYKGLTNSPSSEALKAYKQCAEDILPSKYWNNRFISFNYKNQSTNSFQKDYCRYVKQKNAQCFGDSSGRFVKQCEAPYIYPMHGNVANYSSDKLRQNSKTNRHFNKI